MVDPHCAQRHRRPHGAWGQHRLALLVLAVLLVSVGAALESALPRWPGSSARAQGTLAPQGIRMEPLLAEAVVDTTHELTFQLIDAADNPVPQAGLSLQLVISPPPPRREDALPPSVTPTDLITDANGRAGATLTVGHTSGPLQLLVSGVVVAFLVVQLEDQFGNPLEGGNHRGNYSG